MKRVILVTLLFCFISAPLLAATPKLGVEKRIAINNVKDKIEAIDKKEKEEKATVEEKNKKVELEKRLKDFNGKVETVEEYLVKLQELQAD